MVVFDVMFETVGVAVEIITSKGAYETHQLHVFVCSEFVISQLGEGVDYDTEDDVETDQRHSNEEAEIEEETSQRIRPDPPVNRKSFSQPSTRPQPISEGSDETLENAVAPEAVLPSERAPEEGKRNNRVNVDDDDTQTRDPQQRPSVLGHSLQHTEQDIVGENDMKKMDTVRVAGGDKAQNGHDKQNNVVNVLHLNVPPKRDDFLPCNSKRGSL
eukprot:Lithocolla_globosa_v1_NODE_1603_length_2454_cov_7.712380.p2 type:complete len:215 gc:universal NODE_1603_length_2454_cov_7.712380:354-998(+)